ncbi:hypothetical protein V6N13_095622 [Hibiscus sabdariffa]
MYLYYKKSKSVFKELNQVMFVVELDERASTESEIYSCSSVSTYETLFLDSELEMLDVVVSLLHLAWGREALKWCRISILHLFSFL